MAFKSETIIEVAQAAKALLERGEQVTQRALLLQMGGGSFATVAPIHKRLKDRTKNFSHLKPLTEMLGTPIQTSLDKLLGQAEFTIEALEAENVSLRAKAQAFDDMKKKLDTYQSLYEGLKSERESFTQTMTRQKEHEIAYLKEELKSLNLHYAKQQREEGSLQDEKFLAKQLEVIQLQDQVQQLRQALKQAEVNPRSVSKLLAVPDRDKFALLEKQVKKLKKQNQKLQQENADLIGRLHEGAAC